MDESAMAARTVVQCRLCGRPYSARIVGEETIVLPTDDGHCACGSDDLALPSGPSGTDADAERAE